MTEDLSIVNIIERGGELGVDTHVAINGSHLVL